MEEEEEVAVVVVVGEGGTGRTSIIKITSQITSGNKSTASGRPQPQKLDEKGVLRRRLTSAALRRTLHQQEPRLDQTLLPAVTHAHTHTEASAPEDLGFITGHISELSQKCGERRYDAAFTLI